MLWFLLIVVIGIGFLIWENRKNETLLKVKNAAEKFADVNKDGKVDLADAIAASNIIKEEIVEDVAVVKEEVKKVRRKYGSKVKKNKN